MQKKPPDQYNIFRIDTGGKNGRTGTHGYQVRIEIGVDKRRKLFSDSIHKSKENALLKAKEWRDTQLNDMGVIDGSSRISIDLPSNNTSGIIGVSRSESIDKSAYVSEVWQTTYLLPDKKTKNKKFNVKVHGELGALKHAIEARVDGLSNLIGIHEFIGSIDNIRYLIDRYLNILVYIDGISPKEEEFLLKTIMDESIKNTDKEDIINGRIGQKSYKEKLSIIWGNKCSVTGACILLNASHIKPWAKSNDRERLDPYNGFLLSPVYDRAFDEGYISFDDDGNIIISSDFLNDSKCLGIKGNEVLRAISPFNIDYLKYHRSHVYRDNDS